jgi:hypothetical protein
MITKRKIIIITITIILAILAVLCILFWNPFVGIAIAVFPGLVLAEVKR